MDFINLYVLTKWNLGELPGSIHGATKEYSITLGL